MDVTGASHCYLVGWIGGDTLSIHLIPRNQRFIDAMHTRLKEFWGYVQRREIPPVDDSEATKSMLGLIYPRDTGDEISLPDDFIELDRELVELKESIKTLETRKDGIENRIKAQIGDATRGVLPVGCYSWKVQTRTVVDSEKLAQIAPEVYQECLRVSSFRVLRRSKN
jgi:predicted phage-related endonuclease